MINRRGHYTYSQDLELLQSLVEEILPILFQPISCHSILPMPCSLMGAAILATEPIPAGNCAPTYGSAKFPQQHPGDMQTKRLNDDWRLIIYDYGAGYPSTIDSWQTAVASGVLSIDAAGVFGSEVSLKQNPVEDFLSIEVNSNFNSLDFEIYDIIGKLVKKEDVSHNENDIKIDASDLSAGMYSLKATKDGKKTQSIKFVKK